MGIIEAKEQDFRNIVEEISKDMDLETIPEVIFYDRYIPNKSFDVQAGIDINNHIIHVSKRHLITMNDKDIRNTVIHELSHYKVNNHGSDFNREFIETKIGSFKPSSGVVHIDGSKSCKNDISNENKLTPEQISKCERYYEISQKRFGRGETDDSAFADKPEGYSDWLKKRYKKTGGIKFPPWKDVPKIECKICGNKYFNYYDKCPHFHDIKLLEKRLANNEITLDEFNELKRELYFEGRKK